MNILCTSHAQTYYRYQPPPSIWHCIRLFYFISLLSLHIAISCQYWSNIQILSKIVPCILIFNPSDFSVIMVQNHYQGQLGEERLYSILELSGHTLLRKVRNSCQESRDRDWSISHEGMLLTSVLSMACSTCFLVQPRTNYSEAASAAGSSAIVFTPWF